MASITPRTPTMSNPAATRPPISSKPPPANAATSAAALASASAITATPRRPVTSDIFPMKGAANAPAASIAAKTTPMSAGL